MNKKAVNLTLKRHYFSCKNSIDASEGFKWNGEKLENFKGRLDEIGLIYANLNGVSYNMAIEELEKYSDTFIN